MDRELPVADLSDYFSARARQYADGKPVLNLPPRESVGSVAQGGWLGDTLAFAKELIRADECWIPTNILATRVGLDQKVVERMCVNLGLEIIYMKASKFGGKKVHGRGLRRTVGINHRAIRGWAKDVKRYRKKEGVKGIS